MGKGKKAKGPRKAMRKKGAFFVRNQDKPKTAPGEIQEKPRKPGWLRPGKAKKLRKPKPPEEKK
jgi:hypothetical protein